MRRFPPKAVFLFSGLLAAVWVANSNAEPPPSLDFSGANTIERWCSDENDSVRFVSGNLGALGYHRCTEADAARRDVAGSPYTLSKLPNLTLVPEPEAQPAKAKGQKGEKSLLASPQMADMAKNLGAGYQDYLAQLNELADSGNALHESKLGSRKLGRQSNSSNPMAGLLVALQNLMPRR